MKRITCYLLMLLYASGAFGNARGVEMPDVFSDNMILQRETVVPVWGRAEDGTKVSVSFAGITKKAKAKEGVWRVEFPPMEANKIPQTMMVSASGGFEKEFRNVLIGDVWFASGQSNMEFSLHMVNGGAEAISASENPMLRLFKVPRILEEKDWPLGTSWHEANPESTPPQSAVGYFFAQELQKELDIPIGLLNCSYGGTVTETWCSPEVLKASFPEWEAWEKARLQDPEHPKQNTSSFLYNRMVKSVLPFPVKGFIWYQGEGNAGRPEEQKKLFPAMVNDWRKSWGNEELPFYFVQLARYERANWHKFRDAQREIAENLPHSYLAVTIDLSKDWNIDNHPIHPTTKKPIGHRLALAALANVYGKEMVYSGPVVKEMEVETDIAILSFNHIGSRLQALDGKRLRGFYISDDGENFVEAEAKISGSTVSVSGERVRAPVAVRYGAEEDMGAEDLNVNLGNAEGLPASPFTMVLPADPEPVENAQKADKPNVIVIIADDLGYADLGCHGSPDVKTPYIDQLAENGVRFTSGYVSAPQCGPSRAGLLTGRYQNRFGFESNEFARMPAIPVSQKLISNRFKAEGYVTGYMGKWGVGNLRACGMEYIPPQRGFDESYWNSDGNFQFGAIPSIHDVQVYRDNEEVEQPFYSTDAFGSEAVKFIKRYKEDPFLLFVSFIPPHVPMEAKEEDLLRFKEADFTLRDTMLAMVACVDDNIGKIMTALREEKLEENTLVFFISDNGGATLTNASHNDPFRGYKADLLEGGIRESFIMQWKGKLPAGTVYNEPVISLDILPTALAAAEAVIRPEWQLDGVNLLPYITGKKQGSPHEALYWRFNIWTHKPDWNRWAIRQGDWVLVHNRVGHSMMGLYNIIKDPGQENNLVRKHPDKTSEMLMKWRAWDALNVEGGGVK